MIWQKLDATNSNCLDSFAAGRATMGL